MDTDNRDKGERLAAEKEFQNHRVTAMQEGKWEPRDRFYYLLERAQQAFEETIGDVRGQRVLVVGCSEGLVTPLARRGARVTGIDISTEAIKRLNESIHREGLHELADTQVMDAEQPVFPDSTFDLICCSGVLHHLSTGRAAEAWSRILRPSGRVVMLEPMAWNPPAMIYRWLTPSARTPDEHPLKPQDFKLLRRSFETVNTRAFALTSILSLVWIVLPNLWNMKHRTMRWLEGLDDQLLRLAPALKYLCWAVVIDLRLPRKA